MMCRVLEVSRSGYYDWVGRPQSARAQRHEAVKKAVLQVYQEQHGIPGSRKICEELTQSDDLPKACRNTVQSAMTALNIEGTYPRRFKPVTTQSNPDHVPAPNTLNQDFTATAPNQKWVTDITYIWTENGWVYLAVMLDLFSRKVVGWEMKDSLETALIEACLRKAVEARRPGSNLLHHSDRGSQYTSESYRTVLDSLKMACSMSRKGCCYDNAVSERFFWSLKHEWTNHRSYATLDDARFSVYQYIETYYNRLRRHEALDYNTPEGYEAAYATGLNTPNTDVA
jgi:putative transposase